MGSLLRPWIGDLEIVEDREVGVSVHSSEQHPDVFIDEIPISQQLKQLPSHLEYAFLDGDSRLPVIIAAELTEEEKKRLIEVLKAHKQAIAWKLMDIKVVTNEKNELIPTRTVTGWRVCIDYRKLNDATRKDHFPLPFVDQMMERLSGQQFYCFLDGFSGYFQIPISVEDQEKTTFTCPYGTFAYRRMPFGLCNAPATFQRCMVAIFPDMIEDSMEVFMDDFSVFGSSFDHCLRNLDRMLARCVDTNLMLNWPMTQFLGKDAPFVFSEECLRAFELLKENLVNAPILIAPDWSSPFELMCDASDFAEHYTTTEKELLAMVFAFDKFRSYLVLSKTIVYIDHAELRLENPEREEMGDMAIEDIFLHEFFMVVKAEQQGLPWFDDFSNYLVDGVLLKGLTHQQKKKFFADVKHYFRHTEALPRGTDWRTPWSDTNSEEGNRYILVAVDYVSKWVEAQPCPTNDARVVVRFLKKLFARFGTPKALISDRGTHFCNKQMEKALQRYGATHRLATAYHPKMSGQVEVSNRGIKRILEKTVSWNRLDWAYKLDDALWAFRTAYKTPTGSTPFRMIYDMATAKDLRFHQLHELEELSDHAYEDSHDYKARTKALHDRKLRGDKDFKCGDAVLLYNSRLRLFPGKLKSRWSRPYKVKEVFPYGTVEVEDKGGHHLR
ncbi:hypothetical protein E3N88_07202 [Mikania micrantha]|uniref:Integrase catalytic domain-containing protein n=1 Tax=Mikania micrantha TaxID=192012 RepID=A0A5N6PS93_9ASTR|nr:hypothetical protein E3N88_07202 [Mikania micrantha]